jgi:hypothetical protein
MHGLCATRALKNARRIQAVAPHVFPATEPLNGFSSIVPFDVLRTFDRMTEDELRPFPGLLEAARILHERKQPVHAKHRHHAFIFGDPPFHGTVYFAKITFQTGTTAVSVSDTDMATMLQYAAVALPAIAKYASQYGENRLALSSNALSLNVDVPFGTFNDDSVKDWVRALLAQVPTPAAQSCIVVFRPDGVVNTDADPSQRKEGYHQEVTTFTRRGSVVVETSSPYCFVNVFGRNFTVADRGDHYANTLSHEVAEMTADPFASWANPEICDACAGNCDNLWRSFFAVSSTEGYTYLRSAMDFPPRPFEFDFFTAAVVQPSRSGDCPAPQRACAYAPTARAGIGELLFYERPHGYGELYSVDANAGISLQTTHPNWRDSWAAIVPGRYAAKPPGGRRDVLFYDRSAGVGEFYETGNLGDMEQFSVHDNWRGSWSIIVPGSFAAPGSMDLLFYDPAEPVGEFYRTDGRGNLRLIKSHSDWRATWSIILAGTFSDSSIADLLFYDPAAGVGEFYRTDGAGNLSSIRNHQNWRTTWSMIIPGNFSDSPFTDLLFYDPSAGVGEFYRTDGRGNLSSIRNHQNWRTTWSIIVPGKFSDSPFTDLLFYDPSAGVGEFYRTDGRGNLSSIQNHQNWRTTWTIIDSL